MQLNCSPSWVSLEMKVSELGTQGLDGQSEKAQEELQNQIYIKKFLLFKPYTKESSFDK